MCGDIVASPLLGQQLQNVVLYIPVAMQVSLGLDDDFLMFFPVRGRNTLYALNDDNSLGMYFLVCAWCVLGVRLVRTWCTLGVCRDRVDSTDSAFLQHTFTQAQHQLPLVAWVLHHNTPQHYRTYHTIPTNRPTNTNTNQPTDQPTG